MATRTTTIRTTTTTFGWCAAVPPGILPPGTFVHPCTSESESAGVFDFAHLYTAYRQCRRRKRHTRNAQRYEVRLLDHLWATVQQLYEGTWKPGRSIFFIALKPKAREIHAADFADRVVHHALVPPLEALFEPVFIHDCYSNRTGKGTHEAVKRLQAFMKSTLDRHGEAWYLQLDVRNFFNTIHRPLLFQLLNRRLGKAVRQGRLPALKAREISWCCHTLLKHHPAENLVRRGPEWTFNRVPEYKRLAGTDKDKGLPIGNLTSQFFANVYLNELDQYIKHTLKCRCYLRYVDDMVLVHPDPETLSQWRQQIGIFLTRRLQLELKPDWRLQPVGSGADFLGYIVRPGYLLVRRRVVDNLQRKLRRFERQLLHRFTGGEGGWLLDLHPERREQLRATLASYLGHFKHANSVRLILRVESQFPWISQLFRLHFRGRISHQGVTLIPQWQPAQVSSLRSQWRYFKQQLPEGVVILQVGSGYELYDQDALLLHRQFRRPLIPRDRIGRVGVQHCLRYRPPERKNLVRRLRRHAIPYQLVVEEGYLHGGMKRRVLCQQFSTQPLDADSSRWSEALITRGSQK
jgi:hypothetical protein